MTRTWSFLLLAFSGLILLGAASSPPEVWSSAGYEIDPEDTDNVQQGAKQIRDTKIEIRSRMNVEHHFGTITNGDNTDDNGLHRVGSARCFVDTTAPVTLCDPGTACTDHDNAGGPGVSALSDTATNSSAAEDVGDGRCWIDTDGPDDVAGTADDDAFYVYENNAWSLVTSTAGGINPRTPNLLYNGDFEVNGDPSTVVPNGWVAVGTPDYVHDVTEASEGAGISIQVTDTAGGAEGIEQVITAESLKPSTVYQVTARVMPTAGDTCRLDVTNAGDTNTGPADSAGAGGSFETLGLTFTTDATPNDTDVELISTAVSDVCEWDHVGVFEIGGVPARPSRWIFEGTHSFDSPSLSTGETFLDTSGGGVTGGSHDPLSDQDIVAIHESCIMDVTAAYSVVVDPSDNDHYIFDLQARKDAGTWTTISGGEVDGLSLGASQVAGSQPLQHRGYVHAGSDSNITMEAGSLYDFRVLYSVDGGHAPDSIAVTCGAVTCRITVDVDCRQ